MIIDDEIKTIYGYNVEHLVIVAELLRKSEITPYELKNAVDLIKFGYNYAVKEFNKIVETTHSIRTDLKKGAEIYEKHSF